MGENQIKEIIHASCCSVFFIDESQRVTISDIGSVSEIQKWAKEEDSEVSMEELVSQFRCNGSDGYLAWLDGGLDIRDTANYDMDVVNYCILMADVCNLDLDEIVLDKIKRNNEKYPVEKAYGNKEKYTEL